MFDHRLIFVLIIIIILLLHWVEIEKGGFQKSVIIPNSNFDLLQQKLGTPQTENDIYIWTLPNNYPFFQVRLDNNNIIYVSVKIDKPINLNLDNINVSLDSTNGILWVFNSNWNEVIINLYYAIFDIKDDNLMNKTRYILNSKPKLEYKLISDIYKKLEETVDNIGPQFISEENIDQNINQNVDQNINRNVDPEPLGGNTKGNQLDANWNYLPGNDSGNNNFFSIN
jgi:hypothetical protein